MGIVLHLVARKTGRAAYRTGIGLAIAAAALLGWINGAVGIIGSENNRANLMYLGVVAVGVVGVAIARLKPGGMALAMMATAATQGLVTVVAIVGGLGGPNSGPLELLAINGAFIALFLGAASLFRKTESG